MGRGHINWGLKLIRPDVQLKQELKAEIEHSKAASKLSASTSAAPAQTAQLPEEVEKNEASLRLYEDLTDLQIYNVHLKHGEKKSSKETTYNCVQTIDGRSKSALDPPLGLH